MKWLKQILLTFAASHMALGSALAQSLTPGEQVRLSQYRNYLEPMGYFLNIDANAKKAFVIDKSSKQLALEIPFSDEETLRKYSPKSLNRRLLEEMSRVKVAGKAALSHSLQALPSESFIFFMAMGSVVAGQLFTNYAQNPVAMKQHLEHQLSPVGVMGFYAFMASQGAASNVLSLYLTNPMFRHLIPYLGMSVGAFVQSYLSQVASDPNVIACGKTMLGSKLTEKDQMAGADSEPCEKAYEHLVIGKKLWEFAPGMISMLASSALAGVAQATVARVASKLTGVDLAMWLTPGAAELKGVRLMLVKGVQIAAFVSIDAWLNRKVNFAWKNFFDGNEFNNINENLNAQVNAMKMSSWNTSAADLSKELKNLRSKMTDWRMMNMAEVYESHQAWSENILQLTSMYNSSYTFYNSFINEVRSSRFDSKSLHLLSTSYPLNGVTAKNIKDQNLYFQAPKMIENSQADTVYETVDAFTEFAKTADFASLYDNEKSDINKIINLLNSDDRLKMAEGLLLLNRANDPKVRASETHSTNYARVLHSLRLAMGNPEPMLEPGRGFLATYESAPVNAEALKGTPYYRNVGIFNTPRITDYLLMQMICGPDVEKGEKAVRNTRGFPALFLPPRLISNADDLSQVCYSPSGPSMPVKNIYTWPIRSKNGQQHAGFISYLIDQARESAVGSSKEAGFPQWWTEKTGAEMQKTFETYSKSYDGIVANMLRLIYQSGSNDKSIVNRGPISNGAMNSAFQEERAYLSVLNQLLQPNDPFVLDLAKILSAGHAPSNPLLKEIENQFAILNGMIKKIEITKIDNQDAIKSSIENYQLEEQQSEIHKSLEKLAAILGIDEKKSAETPLKLTAGQKEVAVICLENLQALAGEIKMYGSMANAVRWDKIQSLKQVTAQQNIFDNQVRDKLKSMQGLTMPGKR